MSSGSAEGVVMLKMQCLFAALVLSLAFATPSLAHTIVYQADFAPEGGPLATGSGTAIVTVDTDLFTMQVHAIFADLSGLVTQAHIHCCTTSPGTGNAGVATVLPSFTSFPTGVSAGTYDFTYDMTLAASFNPAFVTANAGSLPGSFNALVLGLDTDRAYFNIHTSTFPGGEIRARLVPIPEPATAGLVLLGLGLLASGARLRSRSA